MPTALITGASRGLGRAVASHLAADNWDLIIDGRDPAKLAEAGATFNAATVSGDVAKPAHREALMREVHKAGRLDLLLNNASTLGPTPLTGLARLDIVEFARILDVNTVAPLALAQASLPMLQRSGGVIINLSSDAGVEAYPGWGGYGASKAALDHLTAVLAAEHPNLAIYSLDPGDMRTDMHQAAFPGEDISDRPLPDEVVPAVLRLIATRPPSGRYTTSDLLAEVGQ